MLAKSLRYEWQYSEYTWRTSGRYVKTWRQHKTRSTYYNTAVVLEEDRVMPTYNVQKYGEILLCDFPAIWADRNTLRKTSTPLLEVKLLLHLQEGCFKFYSYDWTVFTFTRKGKYNENIHNISVLEGVDSVKWHTTAMSVPRPRICCSCSSSSVNCAIQEPCSKRIIG